MLQEEIQKPDLRFLWSLNETVKIEFPTSLHSAVKNNIFFPDCSNTIHNTLRTSSVRKNTFRGGHKPNFFDIYSMCVHCTD